VGRGDSQAICTSLTESQWQPSLLPSTSSIPPSFCPFVHPSFSVCIPVYPSRPVPPSVSLLSLSVVSLHYSVCRYRRGSRVQTRRGDRQDLKTTLMWVFFLCLPGVSLFNGVIISPFIQLSHLYYVIGPCCLWCSFSYDTQPPQNKSNQSFEFGSEIPLYRAKVKGQGYLQSSSRLLT